MFSVFVTVTCITPFASKFISSLHAHLKSAPVVGTLIRSYPPLQYGMTPLHYAAMYDDQFETVRLLLDRGADNEATDIVRWGWMRKNIVERCACNARGPSTFTVRFSTAKRL